MLRPTFSLSLMILLTATTLAACPADKNETESDAGTANPATTGTDATDATAATAVTDATDATVAGTMGGTMGTDTATDTATDTTPTTTMVGGETAADGEACSQNGDCMSLGCLKLRDAADGECVAAPANMATRIAGTVLDFATAAPIPSVELRVIGALSALGDPANATPVAKGDADANGVVDFVSPEALKEGIGIVGIITGGLYYTTATGLASPVAGKYGPMNGIRDIWAVPSAKLTEWSTLLALDAEVMPFLPLGDNGGVVGLVRNAADSAPMPGAKVLPVDAASKSFIRYLSDDGLSFNSNATGTSGIFVLVNPGLAEKFTVEGSPDITGSAGSAKGAVFVMILGVP
ncbi:MAG: hypothetical protein H0T76_15115 [Nannocystis sp.]|nr:hypothetical protein [Nannocystis sp.]MBA3547811.1 hypothetical protein [Nannocystis sp.]